MLDRRADAVAVALGVGERVAQEAADDLARPRLALARLKRPFGARDEVVVVGRALRRGERVEQRQRERARRDVRRLPRPLEDPTRWLHQRPHAPVRVELAHVRVAAEDRADTALEVLRAHVEQGREGLVHRRGDDAQQKEEEEHADEDFERGASADIRHASKLAPEPDGSRASALALAAELAVVIMRYWRGWASPENADAYERIVTTQVLPHLAGLRLDGYHGAYLMRRETGGEVEFATITIFDSLDDVRAFAGDDYERAFVPEEARAVLSRFDERCAHYETLLSPDETR